MSSEIEQLTRKYGAYTAVDDLSFVAIGGETGFLGPNGAGMSTTMRVLTGFSDAASGGATIRASRRGGPGRRGQATVRRKGRWSSVRA